MPKPITLPVLLLAILERIASKAGGLLVIVKSRGSGSGKLDCSPTRALRSALSDQNFGSNYQCQDELRNC